ncbi:MAG: hypothetical protein ITG01_05820 [Comamonas sp.]|nr:hypothetical protein [Comamonas sp.]
MNTTAKTKTQEPQLVDITEFDVVSACEAGHEFELRSPDGSGTGIKLQVLGAFAPEVVKWNGGIAEKMISEQRIAQRKGKSSKPKTMEELSEQNIEGALIRVKGWSGVKQAYTQDLMRNALKRNPHWVGQVIEESEHLGNFGTTSASSSEAT